MEERITLSLRQEVKDLCLQEKQKWDVRAEDAILAMDREKRAAAYREANRWFLLSRIAMTTASMVKFDAVMEEVLKV